MLRMFQLPMASAELVFEGGEICNARADYPEVVITADTSGISVIVPDTIDENEVDEIAFYLTEVLGFEELNEEAIRRRPQCKVFPCARGFLLTPEMLHSNGQKFLEVAHDLEELQVQCGNQLDIYIRRDNSFLVCLPRNIDEQELLEKTSFLSHYLDAKPKIVDLRMCS